MSEEKASIRKVLEDIFDIAPDGSNIKTSSDEDTHENAYSSATADVEQSLSFEEKIKSIPQLGIAKSDDEVLFVDNSIAEGQNDQKVQNHKNEDNKTKNQKEILLTSNKEQELFEVDSKSRVLSSSNTTSQKTQISNEIQQSQHFQNNRSNESNKELDKIPKFEWNFTTSNKDFEAFYNAKKNIIQKITKNNYIDFDTIEHELKNAKVSIDHIELYDAEENWIKMKEIQSWKDRICHIQFDINTQYHLWERFIDILRGVLTNYKHEKPAQRQEAVNYEHLEDAELYFSRLKALHKNIDNVIRNLDAAFDILSRHISIFTLTKDSVPNKRYESHKKVDNNTNKSEKLEDFDKLETFDEKEKITQNIIQTKQEQSPGKTHIKTGKTTFGV